MKKIISLLFVSSLLLTGCSSDDDDTADSGEVEATFTLDATGAVAEQTAAQAKKPLMEVGQLVLHLQNLFLKG